MRLHFYNSAVIANLKMGHYKTNTDSKCEFFSKAAVLYITVTQCYVNRKNYWKKSPLVGVEPTTFELEVQRASPLRHRGCWYISHCYCVNNRENRRFSLCPGGYFRDFWVGMCRWDPGTLSLYESSFKWILLPYTRLNSQNPPHLHPYPRVAVFQKLLRSQTQSSQNKTDSIFFIFLSGNSRYGFPSLD